MTYIPKRVIGADADDLKNEKERFMKWTSEKDYGTQFLTLEQVKDQGVIIEMDEIYGDWISDKARTLLPKSPIESSFLMSRAERRRSERMKNRLK